MRFKLALLLILTAACGAKAAEHAPRVLSPNNADAYSMKTFAQFARWKDLTGDAKVYEIYKYLADTRTGIFPMGAGAWEGKDNLYEFGYIRDPIKMINVYSCGYCDMLGPTMEGIMKDMGIGPARTLNLPSLSHVVAEVFYNDKWHYLDLDLRAVFRRADGTLASYEESRKEDAAWVTPHGPLFFPNDNVANMRRDYAKANPEYRYGVNMGGATMDYVLRQGETFTRWWQPQQDRWNHHESYHKSMKQILDRQPAGPKCKHTNYSVWTHGNGKFVYKPNLSAKSTDFADGAYDSKNVQPGPGGLTLKTAGEGYAIFEVRSPYVIVPRVGKYETTEDDTEASVVKLDAEGASLAISQDNGLTWKDVKLADGAADLTQDIARTYGYLLRISLKGEPDKAMIKSLEVTTWVQIQPASLPSLKKGANQMQYVTGDHYGLQTRVVEIRPNGSDKDDFFKYLSEPPKNYNPKQNSSRATGRFVAKVDAPPNTKIAWFSGGGAFTAQQGDNAPNTKNTMAYALDETKDFKQFYKAAIPAGQCHWHYNADVEVKLEKPAKTVFVEYVGNPAVNNIRILAHCLEDTPPAPRPVTITHAWKEKGALKTKTVKLDRPGPYEVVTEDDPADESIEMAVPSGIAK